MLGNVLAFFKAKPSIGLRFGGKPCGFSWRVGIYSRAADVPILGRCEVFATDPDEAMVLAKDRVDRANLL